MRVLPAGRGFAFVFLFAALFCPCTFSQDNSYDKAASGKWHTAGNWSLGARPDITQSGIFITNATPKTVTIDGTTSGSFPASLSISNLTLSAPVGSVNTLLLQDAGVDVPLEILNGFWVRSGGAMTITNSALTLDSDSGGYFPIDGIVTINSASITATNSTGIFLISVGEFATGDLLVNDGRIVGDLLVVGRSAGSQGAFSLRGGACVLNAGLQISTTVGAAGTVWVTGGELVTTNSAIYMGTASSSGGFDPPGFGQMTVSNGTVRSGGISVQSGMLTVAGGTIEADVLGVVGFASTGPTTGTVWMTGGEVSGTSSSLVVVIVDGSGVYQMTLSNGAVRASASFVGASPAGRGVLSVAGGVFDSGGFLRVGQDAGSTGIVTVTGGELIVTNGNPFSQATVLVGEGGFGRLTVFPNGTLVAGRILIGTNSTGSGELVAAGGTITVLSESAGVIGVGNDGTLTNGTGAGQLTVSNGTLTANTILLGSSAGGQGNLTIGAGGLVNFNDTNAALVVNAGWLTGGTLILTNGTVYVGRTHPGELIVSNGTALCHDVFVGYDNAGILRMINGLMSVTAGFTVGHLPGSTGMVWITGGQLIVTNQPALIGDAGVGQITMTGGYVLTDSLVMSNAQGRFFLQGGLLDCGNTQVANGQTFLVDGNGRLNLRGGNHQFSHGLRVAPLGNLSGCGAVQADVLNLGSITNACGGNLLTFTGLLTNRAIIAAVAGGTIQFNGPVVNDGGVISATSGSGLQFNQGVQHNNGGQLQLPPQDDSDGDGLTNAQEAIAGTDPLNRASAFRAVEVTRVGNDIRVGWTAVGGKQYTVQSVTGSYSTNFVDIGTVLAIGTGDSVTNYLHLGGALGSSNRFYRVRVLP